MMLCWLRKDDKAMTPDYGFFGGNKACAAAAVGAASQWVAPSMTTTLSKPVSVSRENITPEAPTSLRTIFCTPTESSISNIEKMSEKMNN